MQLFSYPSVYMVVTVRRVADRRITVGRIGGSVGTVLETGRHHCDSATNSALESNHQPAPTTGSLKWKAKNEANVMSRIGKHCKLLEDARICEICSHGFRYLGELDAPVNSRPSFLTKFSLPYRA
jgi:hypothetical protein